MTIALEGRLAARGTAAFHIQMTVESRTVDRGDALIEGKVVRVHGGISARNSACLRIGRVRIHAHRCTIGPTGLEFGGVRRITEGSQFPSTVCATTLTESGKVVALL